MNIQTVVDEYLKACRANGLRPNTVRWYKSLLKSLTDTLSPECDLTSITTSDLRQYIINLEDRSERYLNAPQKPTQAGALSKDTIASHVTGLHAFFAWAAVEYQTANPMKNIKRRRRASPEPKAISSTDFLKLFHAADDDTPLGIRNRALLVFMADSGCRLGGIRSLKVSRLELANRRALVNEKGGKLREVVFTTFTARLLARWLSIRAYNNDFVFTSLDGIAITESGIAQVIKRLKKKAGVTGRTNPHSFRHNFARAYLQNGGNIVTLAKLLGHSDINTTSMYYAIFTRDELAELHTRYSPLVQILDELL